MKLQCKSIPSTVAAQIEEFLSSLVCLTKYRTNNSQLPHPIQKGVNPIHITSTLL